MTIEDAIRRAERLLPEGRPAADGAPDERWQAIIAVGAFLEQDPDAVWQFARRWGAHEEADIRTAIATCLLEHLLEERFEVMLPRIEAEVRRTPVFADTVRRCWAFGQAATPPNQARLARVQALARTVDPIVIVDAEPADAEAIHALQILAYQSEARRYDNWSIPPLVESVESVREHIARHVVLKAQIDGRLAGSVRGVVEDGVCLVGRLIVDPALQQRGIGTALLDAIETRHPDVTAFKLFTGDRSEGNLRLYRRHGYVETHRQPVSSEVSLVFLRKPAGRAEAS